MKVGLNKKQLRFLEEKFNITKSDVQKMDRKQWNKVREDCFEIETDELLDCEKMEEIATIVIQKIISWPHQLLI